MAIDLNTLFGDGYDVRGEICGLQRAWLKSSTLRSRLRKRVKEHDVHLGVVDYEVEVLARGFRALTELLVDKGVVTREELERKVAELDAVEDTEA